MNQLTRFNVASALLLTLAITAGCNKSNNDVPIRLEEISDTELTFKVKVTLLSDKKVSRLEIKVKTKNGVVRLTGAVENQGQIDYVDKLVRNIGGVQNLHDELTVVT